MDSRFNKNESELTILISSELLNMLSDVNSLLDQAIEIFWELRSNTLDLKNSEDLRASDSFNLRNTIVISEDDTDLGRSTALSSEFDNLLNEIIGTNLDPTWRNLSVWKTSTGNTFSLGVHSTHGLLVFNN